MFADERLMEISGICRRHALGLIKGICQSEIDHVGASSAEFGDEMALLIYENRE